MGAGRCQTTHIVRIAGENPISRLAAEPNYQAIELPGSASIGFVKPFFASITGFALIWHIWRLVVLGLVTAPGAVLIHVLAVARMSVHLVFFLHMTTGPDNTNNILALVFGIIIVECARQGDDKTHAR